MYQPSTPDFFMGTFSKTLLLSTVELLALGAGERPWRIGGTSSGKKVLIISRSLIRRLAFVSSTISVP